MKVLLAQAYGTMALTENNHVQGYGNVNLAQHQYRNGVAVDDIDLIKCLIINHGFTIFDVVADVEGDFEFFIFNFRWTQTDERITEAMEATMNEGYKFLISKQCKALMYKQVTA